LKCHYDTEVDEKNAETVAEALVESHLPLAMITPGAHSHFAYGGIASLDLNERRAAEEFGKRTVDFSLRSFEKKHGIKKSFPHLFYGMVHGAMMWQVLFIKEMRQNLQTRRGWLI